MHKPSIPLDERQRLETLRALHLLESAPEERFDRLTRIAKRIFGVPISLVTLVDSHRQWFKSNQGLDARETSREVSFCGHAILGDDSFIVPDALEDIRFYDNPLVTQEPNIRFYAGHPLRAANGHKMGTLCIIDTEPRHLEAEDRQLLKDLAALVEQELNALQMATLDELTRISNRDGFMSMAQYTLDMCHRLGQPTEWVFLDLNGLGPINDQYGHAEGDRALRAFANLIRQEFQRSDIFARLGGSEFVALFTDTSEQELELVLERLQDAIDEYNDTEKRGYNLEFSVGRVTTQPEHHWPVDDVLTKADRSMVRKTEQA